jgi:prepilin-type N-terminal cleavage/methylation domain-containing protein
MIKIFKNQRGFTLLESIVAIMVLSLSIAGAFSAIRQSLSQMIISKEEVQAFYLAQEAIEIIRNERDENRLKTILDGTGNVTNWLTDISTCIGGTCRVDATRPQDAGNPTFIYPCGSSWNSCPPLRQDPNTNLYGYDINDPVSQFTREVQIEPLDIDTDGKADQIAVTVRIKWNKGIISNDFKVKTLLFDWL